MKHIIVIVALIFPLRIALAQDIVPEKVELDTVPEQLSKAIDDFLIAVNDGERGNVKLLTLDRKPTFREIVVPNSLKKPDDSEKSDLGFQMKSLLKIDDITYILVYDSRNALPGIGSPSAIWVKGTNSWHIDTYGDPLELAIQKLNISRAIDEIESSK
jgi:hypothetical protein